MSAGLVECRGRAMFDERTGQQTMLGRSIEEATRVAREPDEA